MTTRSDPGAVPPSGPLLRPSGHARARSAHGELPVAWFDKLLDTWHRMPSGASLHTVAESFLDTIASILPDCAIGMCMVRHPDEGESVVLRRSPSAIESSADPSRLFVEWAYELVVPLPSEIGGSTLHCASMAPLPEAGAEARFLEQAAKVIDCALRAVRAEIEVASRAIELAKLEAQIVQSQKLAGLGQIAAGIVHELNNPLTLIVVYSDHLQKKAERAGGEPSDIERLRRISEAAERIRSFAHDLVAYARPSNEASAPVAIHAVIDRALVFCEHVLASSEIEVERRFVPETALVSGLPGQLTQVFVNLVTNACHAMAQRGGRLTVITEPARKGSVRVLVMDTGHGISREHLPKLFDPFFTTKSDGRGTGLGLAIVHDIVSAHGGAIQVESEPGQGTTFILDLPTISQQNSG